jgi:Tol biopolymer transport system component
VRAASVFCVVLGGCGFHSNALTDSGGQGGSDGSASGSGSDGGGGGSDGSGSDTGGTATDCLQHWVDGTPSVSTGQEITALSSAGNDRDPWISADGQRLYFARNPGSQGKSDVYLSTRSAQGFTTADAVVNLDRSDANEERPALSEDEKILVMASDRPGSGAPPPVPRFQVLIASRPSTATDFGTPMPDDPRVVLVNADAIDHLDPFLTGDGLELWLSPVVGPQGRQEIRVATRANLLLDFTAAAAVPELNTMTSSADPALSLDKRIIVFSAKMGNQDTDLYYATRTGATGAFGTPAKVPVANSDSNDGDPVLSADGCDLYFASQRSGGKYHLFHATIAK